MEHAIDVRIHLTQDAPNEMTFRDVHDGLSNAWYRASATSEGGVELWANTDGFEWLARYFLKLARTSKVPGYHDHLPLEFGQPPNPSGPGLTVGLATPEDFVAK